MSQATPPRAAEVTGTKRAGRLRWLVLLVVFVFAVGGAAGGFYWWRAGAAGRDAPSSPEAAERARAEAGVIAFEPFTVNLADRDAQRFLRVNLRLLVNDSTKAKEVGEDDVRMLRVRSAILELLSQQTAEPLTTPEGKTALKQAIAERATAILEHMRVTDVLFSEFVVQF
jgi:flagellar FliL protein